MIISAQLRHLWTTQQSSLPPTRWLWQAVMAQNIIWWAFFLPTLRDDLWLGDNWGLISRDFLLVTLSLCPRVILNTLYDPRPAFLAFLRTHIIIISRTVTFTSNNPGVSGAGPGPRAHTSWQPEPHQLLFLHPLISCLAGGRRTCVLYVSGYPALATPTLCNCKKLLRCKNH